jgi:hypothetical protein
LREGWGLCYLQFIVIDIIKIRIKIICVYKASNKNFLKKYKTYIYKKSLCNACITAAACCMSYALLHAHFCVDVRCISRVLRYDRTVALFFNELRLKSLLMRFDSNSKYSTQLCKNVYHENYYGQQLYENAFLRIFILMVNIWPTYYKTIRKVLKT